MENDRIEDLLVILGSALGTKVRAKILLALLQGDGPMGMSLLADEVGEGIGAVSHHVAILKASRIVVVETEGRTKDVVLSPMFLEPLGAMVSALENLVGEEEDKVEYD